MNKNDIKNLKIKRIEQKIQLLNKDKEYYKQLKSNCVKNKKFEKASEYRSFEIDIINEIDNIWKNINNY